MTTELTTIRFTKLRTTLVRAAWICALIAPAGLALAGPTDEQQAEDAMHDGIDLFRKGQFAEAEAKYEQAWKLKKTSDIAGNLGSVEVKLGRYRDAAEHLSFSLTTLPLTAPQKTRAAIESQLAEAKKHVGQITLDVAPSGAEVKVDEARVGIAPLAAPLFVEPGAHRIVATRDGRTPNQLTVTLKAGEEISKTLRLEPATTTNVESGGGTNLAPVPSATASGTPIETPRPRAVWPWIVGGGIAVAGVVVGATLQGVAAGKVSSASEARDKVATCPRNPTTNPCLEGKQANDAANHLKVGSYVAFGVGGAGLAIGAILYAALPRSKGSARATQIVPVISPGFGGLSVSRSF